LTGGIYPAGRSLLGSSPNAGAGWPGMLIAPGNSTAMSAFSSVAHPAIGSVAASGTAERSPIDVAVLLPDAVVPEQVRSAIQHTVDAVLAPLSVAALAALASPGATGLVLLCAAGMFIGYRQARAASMLRAVGTARFVKSGPLGVVRSGGQVAVHPRTSRAARSRVSQPHDRLEPVA